MRINVHQTAPQNNSGTLVRVPGVLIIGPPYFPLLVGDVPMGSNEKKCTEYGTQCQSSRARTVTEVADSISSSPESGGGGGGGRLGLVLGVVPVFGGPVFYGPGNF